MGSFLVIETGELRGRKFLLPDKGTFTIGRDLRCAIQLRDPMASRIHCILKWDSGSWRLQDQNSSNSTFVNEAPVSEHVLAPGDVIQVGDTLLSFTAQEEDPLLGATVGGYRIEERLGRGGMGTVYLAHQLSIDRPVALKILAKRLAGDASFISSFLHEARAAGRLNHPNVVQVYDAGRDGDAIYISMEYLEGGSLEELLVREGRLSASTAVPMILDALEALAYAERQHIVHRDIKPGNLLMDAEHTVKICDLGIAADLKHPGKTAVGPRAGSPLYMAPEQARGADVDHRADLYALGSTLYRALSGVPPFQGEVLKEVIAAKLRGDLVPLPERVPEVPPAVVAVVEKMMAREPDQRFSSAIEVKDALKAALEVPAPVPRRRARKPAARRRAPPVVNRRAPSSQSSSLTAGVIFAFLLALGLVLYVLWSRSSKPDIPPEEISSSIGLNSPASQSPSSSLVPPKPTPREEQEFALREIGQVYLAWKDGRIDQEEAESRLDSILERFPYPEVKTHVRKSRDDIAKAVNREKNTAEATKALDAKMQVLLKEGNLNEAAAALQEFIRQYPGGGDNLLEWEARLEAAVSQLVEKFRQDIMALLVRGDIGGARELVKELEARLPPEKRNEAAALRESIQQTEAQLKKRAEALGSTQKQVHSALAALDFDGAESLINDAVAGNPEMENRALPLRQEVKLVRDVWSELQSSLKKNSSHRLAFLPGPLERAAGNVKEASPRMLRVIALDVEALRLQAGSKVSPETRSLLSIETKTLLELAGSSKMLPAASVVEGLGLLLLFRFGPQRAEPLLLDSSLEEARREANREKLKEASDLWLEARLKEAQSLEIAFEGGPSDFWDYLASMVGELILGWRKRPDYPGQQEVLRASYLKSREEALARSPPENLFHARTAKILNGGKEVRLSYDFSTDEQIRDFVPPKSAVVNPVGLVKSRKLLTLKGEVRLLEGNPFRERLAVRGIVRALNSSAPNVNVALWTHETDVMSVSQDGRGIDLTRWRFGGGGEPDEIFVFAMGYKLPFEVDDLLGGDPGPGPFGRRGGSPLRGLRAFLPVYLREPSFVILGVNHGSPLHNSRQELIWEMPVGNQIKGGLRFELEMADGKATKWIVDGRRLPYTQSLLLSRLERKKPHQGSMTLFTNGSEVHYGQLEIEGRLDPTWIRAKVKSQAEKELSLLEGKQAGKPEEPKS